MGWSVAADSQCGLAVVGRIWGCARSRRRIGNYDAPFGQRFKIQATPSRDMGRKKVTRRFPRRRLDIPDPRGLFLGPILRGEHVSAIHLPLRATWGALEAPPDPDLSLLHARTDAQQHRRRQAANATSCVPRATASVL